MYKISKEIDLSRLKNRVVTQISFGLNYILLTLEDSTVQFSGPFLFKFGGKIIEREEVYPVDSDFGLLNLLGKRTEEISCNDERTSLTVKFSENSFLLLKSNEIYECFEININGKREIV